MNIIGLSKDVQKHLFGLLVGILHLGNVQFEDRDNYAWFQIDQSERRRATSPFESEFLPDLSDVCRYFGIEENQLKKNLTSKRLEFKEQQENRRIEQRFTFDRAIFTRDALAKGIYARLFDYLIRVRSS